MATVSELLDIARRQIGVKESPPNSNNVRYNTWYYGREVHGSAYPWCVVFVAWVFDQAKVKLPIRTASCGALMRAAQSAGCWVTGDYRPGDVVIYDFPGGARTDHCGIVESVDGSYISAIEGNTSSTSDADGGAVERRARKFSQIVGAVRPSYDKEVEEVRYNTVEECPSWARETIQKLVDKKYLDGTGKGLDLSADMVRLLVILDRAGAFN
mgnify:FL=1